MPGFKFESVLTHRQYLEEMKRKEYADARRAALEKQEHLKRLRMAEKQSAMRLQQGMEKGAAISESLLYINYLEQIRNDIRKMAMEVRRFEKIADQKQAELIDAVKNRKIMERLKEKQAIEQDLELKRKEIKFMGEIAISQYNRKKDMV